MTKLYVKFEVRPDLFQFTNIDELAAPNVNFRYAWWIPAQQTTFNRFSAVSNVVDMCNVRNKNTWFFLSREKFNFAGYKTSVALLAFWGASFQS